MAVPKTPQIKLTQQPVKYEDDQIVTKQPYIPNKDTMAGFKEVAPYAPPPIQQNIEVAAPQNYAPIPQAAPIRTQAIGGVAGNTQAMRDQFFANTRAEAERAARGSSQESENAINRRFAAMGQQGSGAALAVGIKGREASDASRQAAMNQIAGQELQANTAAQEADVNRAVAQQEAEAGRQVAQQESGLGRQMAMRESEIGRQFSANEAVQARNLAREQAAIDLAAKQAQFGTEQENRLAELELARRQFLLDQQTTEFNKVISAKDADISVRTDELFRGTPYDTAGPRVDTPVATIDRVMKWIEDQEAAARSKADINYGGGGGD